MPTHSEEEYFFLCYVLSTNCVPGIMRMTKTSGLALTQGPSPAHRLKATLLCSQWEMWLEKAVKSPSGDSTVSLDGIRVHQAITTGSNRAISLLLRAATFSSRCHVKRRLSYQPSARAGTRVPFQDPFSTLLFPPSKANCPLTLFWLVLCQLDTN